jgi:hypothetical protein
VWGSISRWKKGDKMRVIIAMYAALFLSTTTFVADRVDIGVMVVLIMYGLMLDLLELFKKK